MILVPSNLNKRPFIDYMWSFKENMFMYGVNHSILSEMTIDSRSDEQRRMAKYNEPMTSLKANVSVATSPPELHHRQAGRCA